MGWMYLPMTQHPFTRLKKAPDGAFGFLYGGAGRDRTDDLLNAIQALSQLSYSPAWKGIL